MEGKKAIEGAFKRAEERPSNFVLWDDVADDGWENSQPGPEWPDAAEPMDDSKD